MILNLAVEDSTGMLRGGARLKLNWPLEMWFLIDDPQDVWRKIGFSKKGLFDVKSWGVIWLWDQQNRVRNTVIFRDAPASESDIHPASGVARIFSPIDASFNDARVHWSIDVSATKAAGQLSPLRHRALGVIKKYLPAPVDSNNFNLVPFNLTEKKKTGTNCYVFPAFLAWVLVGGVPGRAGGPRAPFQPVMDIMTEGKKRGAWITPDGIRHPLPGDMYALCETSKHSDGVKDVSHVGVIMKSKGRSWLTADYGQGGWAGKDNVKRRYDPFADTLSGEGAGSPSRAIKGWIDLDKYLA